MGREKQGLKYFRLPPKDDNPSIVLIYDTDAMRMYRFDTHTGLWHRSIGLEYDYQSYQSFDSIGYKVEPITKQEAFALTQELAKESYPASGVSPGVEVGYTFTELLAIIADNSDEPR